MSQAAHRNWFGRFLRPLIVAQVWAFFICAPSLARTTTVSGRYTHHWAYYSAPVRLACVLALGFAIFLIGEMVRQKSQKWFSRIVLLAGLAAVFAVTWRMMIFANVVENDHFLLYLGFLAILLVSGTFVSRRYQLTFTAWTRLAGTCTMMAALTVPVFWANMFMKPVYSLPPVATLELAGSVSQPRASKLPEENVYIFILDEWPYRLTFENKQVKPQLPRLKALSKEALVFHDAHSTGTDTFDGVPGLLFQRDDEFAIQNGNVGFRDSAGDFTPTRDLPNVFGMAKGQGYRTYMVGVYHPYHVLLGDSVDCVRSTSFHQWRPEGIGNRAIEFYGLVLTDIFGQWVTKNILKTEAIKVNRAFVRNTSVSLAFTQAIIEDPLHGQFAVLHIPLPHFPFCYSPEGLKSIQVEYPIDSTELLTEQLAYTDGIVGEILEQIREAGKYDSSTIIFTSDHNWRADPTISSDDIETKTHVPLFIKLPNQTESQEFGDRVSLSRLVKLLDAFQAAENDFTQLRERLQKGEFSGNDTE